MRKVFVEVEDCQPGMKMAETIYNEYGAVIVGESTVLDVHLINKLLNLGILRIKVMDDGTMSQSAPEPDDAEVFKMQYNENVDEVKSILSDISSGKNLDMKKVNHVSDNIAGRINENRDIVTCINELRTADEYTYAHSVNVSLLSMLIAKWMRYEVKTIKTVIQAGLLHDIGKGLIDQSLLNKPEVLSKEEFNEMKKHPLLGYRLLEKMNNVPEEVRQAVLMHHEREDGSGYPMNVKGDKINDIAKIIAVADIYDAMTSNRAYKEKEPPFEVFELMENEAFGVLSTPVVNAFLNNISSYYIGDFVKIDTGELGQIVYINPRHIARPLLKIDGKYVDLSIETKLKIVELL
jgi:putative nucleotidyltransferase with HDIG domain